QCLQLIGLSEPEVHTALLYVFENISDKDLQKVKSYLINPVESREKNLDKLVETETHEVQPVATLDGFTECDEEQLQNIHDQYGLSMGMDDLKFIQNYFKSIHRDPTETEILVLDTYWSDHCRHTTFETELTQIEFENQFKDTLQKTYEYYLELRKELNRSEERRVGKECRNRRR